VKATRYEFACYTTANRRDRQERSRDRLTSSPEINLRQPAGLLNKRQDPSIRALLGFYRCRRFPPNHPPSANGVP